MNIGSLFRGMMGDAKPGEVKQAELKEGQVVRGVVTSVSEDGQEAVVQIQGVKVRAKLETPLQQGETTMLQVQPPGKDGMPVLKPVAAGATAQLPSASMNELLDSFNLPDTKGNREMITQMRAAGIPLTAENVKNIQNSMTQKPAAVPVGEWVQSAAVAIQRGLPVTAQSIAGLQQAIFGPPLHELLNNVDQLLRAASGGQTAGSLSHAGTGAQNAQTAAELPSANPSINHTAASIQNNNAAANPSASGLPSTPSAASSHAANYTAAASTQQAAVSPNSNTAALLGKLQNVIQQLNDLVPSLESKPVGGTSSNGGTAAAVTPTAGEQPESALSSSAAATSRESTGKVAAAAPNNSWLGQVLKLMGAEYENQAVRTALNLTAGAPSSTQAAANAGMPGTALAADAEMTAGAEGIARQAAQTAGTHSASAAPMNQPVPNAPLPPQSPASPQAPSAAFIQPAADGNEQSQPVPNALAHTAMRSAGDDTSLPGPAALAAQPGSVEDSLFKAQDTLKGLLLQLSTAADVPPALKDAAQQLVQQLTGQQLLLNTDRTAPFAQVTMFVPFHGPDGQETASVQIQSRRGSKGELDSSNCRLWFDLDMKSLGPTLVDVHVVDKIVTLKVHNDLEQLAPLIESKKQNMSEAIQGLGYQLLSLQFAAMPVRSGGSTDTEGSGNVTSLIDQYAPPGYKGVDMKV